MQSLVRNGVLLRLPPGFRFHPTDEDLVVHYLRRKVLSLPLPSSIIPEIELANFSPWDLPGCSTEERYFFNFKYPRRMNRAAGSGYWRATGKEKAVLDGGRVVMGIRKTLVFYQGKGLNGRRTEWVMHEYRLIGAGENTGCVRGWVLCRVFAKRKTAAVGRDDDGCQLNGYIEQQPSPASSEVSCVTDGGEEGGD
uniref:NAC protein n=1 Tax=Lilium pumilum TaxID=82327 RepID=A0A4Y1P031_9LILI|nr:NAC protein [Lilium pumilum]